MHRQRSGNSTLRYTRHRKSTSQGISFTAMLFQRLIQSIDSSSPIGVHDQKEIAFIFQQIQVKQSVLFNFKGIFKKKRRWSDEQWSRHLDISQEHQSRRLLEYVIRSIPDSLQWFLTWCRDIHSLLDLQIDCLSSPFERIPWTLESDSSLWSVITRGSLVCSCKDARVNGILFVFGCSTRDARDAMAFVTKSVLQHPFPSS